MKTNLSALLLSCLFLSSASLFGQSPESLRIAAIEVVGNRHS
ncbi:MAG: hypothetical protein AAF146_19280 [Bacteroidota bacterium]